MALTVWLIITVILIAVEIVCGRCAHCGTDFADRSTLAGADSCICCCFDNPICIYQTDCNETLHEEH